MRWYSNLKISAKLIIGFILVSLISAIIGLIGFIGMGQMNTAQDEVGMTRLPSVQALLIMSEAQTAVVVGERGLVNARMMDSEIRKAQYAYISNALKRAEEAWKIYEPLSKSDEESKLWNKFVPEWEQWIKDSHEVVDLSEQKDELIASGIPKEDPKIAELDEKAFQASLVSRESFLVSEASLNKLVDENVAIAKEAVKNSKSAYDTSIMELLIGIVLGFVLAVGLGLFISRLISRPIGKMVDAADKLAMGDVNVNMQVTTKDEIGNLMQSFSRMVGNIREQAFAVEKIAAGDLSVQVKIKSENDLLGKKLSEMIETNNEILTNINFASEQVAAGAKQVSASGQMLSQGSTEQASSIEEITASMNEVAAQTKQNAVNANQANELANTAKENALQGNGQMQDMVNAMADINDSSSRISKIIKVIDEIAFQTNILALNAAVEAARAGQHGKGFAVVAEEVRNLAARSANAAKETTEMIESSIKKVETGTRIANSTAEALNKIVQGVSRAADLVGDIASASSEQASGIAQINQAISQVAMVVQTNSATAEESAAASEELASQAALMKNEVNKFKLKKVKDINNHEVGLNPNIIRMLEEVMDRKKFSQYSEPSISGYTEAVAANENSLKSKITLDNNNFGKY